MKEKYRRLILAAYTILNLLLFWYAQYFMEFSDLFLNLLSLLLLWVVFIGTTITVFMIKPLSFGKAFLRFLVALPVMIPIYMLFYDQYYYDGQTISRDFLNDSLLGFLLTGSYTLIWFIPVDFFVKRKH